MFHFGNTLCLKNIFKRDVVQKGQKCPFEKRPQKEGDKK